MPPLPNSFSIVYRRERALLTRSSGSGMGRPHLPGYIGSREGAAQRCAPQGYCVAAYPRHKTLNSTLVMPPGYTNTVWSNGGPRNAAPQNGGSPLSRTRCAPAEIPLIVRLPVDVIGVGGLPSSDMR